MPRDLRELIAGVTPLLERALGETVRLIIVHQDPETTVMVDPNQFENALLNLAINAAAAMPGGGTLTIETSHVHLDQRFHDENPEARIGDYICTSVTDDGAGMTPEVLAEACEPFFTTKPVGEGSGLGLSMVYGFAVQSGGYMTIDSTVGAGTCIKVFLPVANPSRSIETAAGPATPGFDKSHKVLLVEDNEQLRSISKKLLESLGLEVVAVGDGPGALEQIKTPARFDLLVSDVVLPGGITGWDIAAEFRRVRPDINVIICTGYGFEGSQASDLENVRFLRKPFGKTELAMAIHELMGSSGPALH